MRLRDGAGGASIGAALALALASGCGDEPRAEARAASSGATTTSAKSGGGGEGGAPGAGGSGGAGESGAGVATPPKVRFPKSAIDASELGVLVNDQDPQSVALGAHYAVARGIPAENVITVSFPATGSDNLPAAELTALRAAIDALTPAAVQAYAVTWTYPTRVDCMSLTTALALGFDAAYCNTSGDACGVTAASPYYDSSSHAPFTDHGLRPAMVLAGATLDAAKALVDRGLAADDTYPEGEGYFVRTTDEARSVRWSAFGATVDAFDHEGGLSMTYLDNHDGAGLDYVEGATDVLFYFTGLADVPAVASSTYRPGAVADHLTSFGGSIPAVGQMNVLAWLEAGATASYGTLQEPCNYPQKFPSTRVLVPRYFRGETVIEAYWKSVRWPGEGLFVGEPLARPWGTPIVTFEGGTLRITTTTLDPKKVYELRAADVEAGPYTVALGGLTTPEHARVTLTLERATAPFYELAESP